MRMEQTNQTVHLGNVKKPHHQNNKAPQQTAINGEAAAVSQASQIEKSEGTGSLEGVGPPRETSRGGPVTFHPAKHCTMSTERQLPLCDGENKAQKSEVVILHAGVHDVLQGFETENIIAAVGENIIQHASNQFSAQFLNYSQRTKQ